MNISGARGNAVPNKAGNDRMERIVKDSVLMKQKLARAIELKNKALSDKAAADAMLETAKNDLVAARMAISTLKAQVAELTASLNEALAANAARKQRKNKAAEAEQPAEPTVEPAAETAD